MKRSSMTGGYGIPLDRVLAPANRHDSPLLAPTLGKLDELGPLPMRSGSTWAPGTTPRKPAMSWPPGK
jgi:hypothetical protein